MSFFSRPSFERTINHKTIWAAITLLHVVALGMSFFKKGEPASVSGAPNRAALFVCNWNVDPFDPDAIRAVIDM